MSAVCSDSALIGGLLYYPAGERTLRFRLNLSFTRQDVDFLFEQLDALCRNDFFIGREWTLFTTVVTTRADGMLIMDYQRDAPSLLKNKAVGI